MDCSRPVARRTPCGVLKGGSAKDLPKQQLLHCGVLALWGGEDAPVKSVQVVLLRALEQLVTYAAPQSGEVDRLHRPLAALSLLIQAAHAADGPSRQQSAASSLRQLTAQRDTGTWEVQEAEVDAGGETLLS